MTKPSEVFPLLDAVARALLAHCPAATGTSERWRTDPADHPVVLDRYDDD
jgi:hypothetical protein